MSFMIFSQEWLHDVFYRMGFINSETRMASLYSEGEWLQIILGIDGFIDVDVIMASLSFSQKWLHWHNGFIELMPRMAS